MDAYELSGMLFGHKRAESDASERLRDLTISGVAESDSADGLVSISLDGDLTQAEDDGLEHDHTILIPTEVGVYAGDEVAVTLTGADLSTLRVTGVVGDGDRVNARISGIEADYVKATELEADVAEIGFLKADSAVITDIQADTAKVHNLTAQEISAATGYVADLQAGSVSAQDIVAGKATVGELVADHVSVSDFEVEQANIDSLQAATADIATIRANSAKVQNLTAAQLEADHATIGTLDTTYMHANMSNSDVAWISNGTIKDGAITNAMINSVSANKLTAGTIDASEITVTNLNADNITTGTINGQRIGEGSLSLDKLSEDVYTEAEVNNIVDGLNDRIDGAIETFTGTAVPTLNNSPASSWNTTKLRDEHVGDVYYVVNSQSQQNGYCYRFTKSGSTYSWQLIKDSDVTAALSRLTTAEGKITSFDSDISQLKTDTGTITTKTESLETRMSDAEEDILDKVDTTTFNEVSDTVDQHSQTIAQHTTAISNKADGSTVTSLTNRVSKNEQDISGINTTIGELQETVESKADGSTVSTISNKLNTVSDTVDGHTQTLTSVQNTLSSKADSSTVSTLTTQVNDVSDTVDGHTSQLSSITTTQTTMQTTLDKTVKSSIQLWYSKANTTAPSKPTSQVTSTSTSGGAWRIVVPAYNASYPHYYYCWQYEYTDGTYGWSAVVRDIAMGESQSTARTADSNASAAVTTANTASTTATNAQTRANANIKSSVQLWFTKANSTAPSKPTSVVSTSNANTANAWNLVVPVWNSSYPHYFYCYQQQKGDGTYQWTDVVYDRATSEAQQLANTTSTNLSTLQTNYATFKQQTEQFESTVGTTYATKTELNDVTDDITELEGRVSTNETSISNNASAIALKANSSDVYTKSGVDGLISTEVTNRNAAITAKANEITSSVSETYATKTELDETVDNRVVVDGEFLYRTTGGEQDVPSGRATVQSIRGKTLRWNQLNENGNFASLSGYWTETATLAVADNVLTLTGISASVVPYFTKNVSIAAGHKLLFTIQARPQQAFEAVAAIVENAATIRKASVPSGTWSVVAGIVTSSSSGSLISVYANAGSGMNEGAVIEFRNMQLFDLTAMFGAGNEPVTVDEFTALYPLPYYPYDTGTLLPVRMEGVETTGFNQWDEQWEVGEISNQTGQNSSGSGRIRAKNLIPCFANTSYYLQSSLSTNDLRLYYYDSDKGYIGHTGWLTNGAITTPTGCRYMRFRTGGAYGATYKGDICINLSDPDRNGTYEPHWRSERAIPASTYFPDGMRSAGSVYDELTATQAVTRVGSVDLGTLTWTYSNGFFRTSDLNNIILRPANNYTPADAKCSKYEIGAWNSEIDKSVMVGKDPSNPLLVKDTAYTDAADFKTAMSGVMLDYALATTVTTTIDPPLNLTYKVDSNGTERVLVNETQDAPQSAPLPTNVTYGVNLHESAGDDAASMASIESRVTTAESSITQNANNIALKVSESDVTGNYLVGKINLNSTTASIAAQHINLQGAVTISDLSSDAQSATLNSNTSVGGRNLFRLSDSVAGYLDGPAGGIVGQSNHERTTEYIPVEANTEYMLQAWYDTSNPTSSYEWVCLVWFDANKSNGTQAVRKHMTSANYHGWSLTSPSNAAYVRVSSRWVDTGYMYANVKLEKGNKATDWTPAPEDVDAAISDAAKTATYYVTEITGQNGIMVHPSGNQNTGVQVTSDVDILRSGTSVANYGTTARIGTLAGKHVSIDSDSVDLMDGNASLATFGANDTHLGLAGAGKVYMADDKFLLSAETTEGTWDSGSTAIPYTEVKSGFSAQNLGTNYHVYSGLESKLTYDDDGAVTSSDTFIEAQVDSNSGTQLGRSYIELWVDPTYNTAVRVSAESVELLGDEVFYTSPYNKLPLQLGKPVVRSASKSMTITSTNTWVDGPSVYLDQGQWLVVGVACFNSGSSSGSRKLRAQLRLDSSVYAEGTEVRVASNEYGRIQATAVMTVNSADGLDATLVLSSSMNFTSATTSYVTAVQLA